MRRKLILSVFCSTIVVGILVGCATHKVFIPKTTFEENYDRLFEAAISAGLEDGFTPQYQDKKRGRLQLIKQREGLNQPYTITVQFGKFGEGGQGAEITGRPELATMLPMYTGHIEDAIRREAGLKVK